MKNRMFKLISVFVLITLLLTSCSSEEMLDSGLNLINSANENNDSLENNKINEKLETNSKEEVALYIKKYDKLPNNFITKREARELGWVSEEGNLWEVTEGKTIGGDRFGNREGLLPEKEGRKYYECDINYEGGYRGAERIVYSNDGLIYWTEDHYNSFELIYGDEKI